MIGSTSYIVVHLLDNKMFLIYILLITENKGMSHPKTEAVPDDRYS